METGIRKGLAEKNKETKIKEEEKDAEGEKEENGKIMTMKGRESEKGQRKTNIE